MGDWIHALVILVLQTLTLLAALLIVLFVVAVVVVIALAIWRGVKYAIADSGERKGKDDVA